MAQTLQHAVYIARSILERAQCIVYERRSAGDGRTIQINKQIAHTCLVYVGLAQARPNYRRSHISKKLYVFTNTFCNIVQCILNVKVILYMHTR